MKTWNRFEAVRLSEEGTLIENHGHVCDKERVLFLIWRYPSGHQAMTRETTTVAVQLDVYKAKQKALWWYRE